MSTTTDRAISEDEKSEFESYAKSGLKLLGKIESADPGELVAAVDTYIAKHQKASTGFVKKLFSKAPDNIETSLALGIVWGNQLVRAFRWEWVCVLVEGEERYAVVAPDRSLVVFATYFVKECLDHATADCTVLLSYNMLRENRLSTEPTRGYTSVMQSVRRIVPQKR